MAEVSKTGSRGSEMTFSFGVKAIVGWSSAIEVGMVLAVEEGSTSWVGAAIVDDIRSTGDARSDVVWVSSGMAETVSSPLTLPAIIDRVEVMIHRSP